MIPELDLWLSQNSYYKFQNNYFIGNIRNQVSTSELSIFFKYQ
jgi:hypothetical protein